MGGVGETLEVMVLSSVYGQSLIYFSHRAAAKPGRFNTFSWPKFLGAKVSPRLPVSQR